MSRYNNAHRIARLLLELRRAGIMDARVLGAIERVPRERFVPATFLDQAYENVALPIGSGQTISKPEVVASMLVALDVAPEMRVMEIGTGSGYQTAILAILAGQVYSLECRAPLLREAKRRLSALGLTNVDARLGDGQGGWEESLRVDRIVMSAAAPEVPKPLIEHLLPGGLMILPIGRPGQEQLIMRYRHEGDVLRGEALGSTRFVPVHAGVVR